MEVREFAFEGPLLAVHAHPDDETLTSGGLLAAAVSRGVPVTLVTCTRGEQGEVIGPDPDQLEGDGPALGAHRVGELARAMRALGVTDHVFLDEIPLPDDHPGLGGPVTAHYADSGMAWVSGDLGAGASGAAELPADVSPDAFYFCDLDAAALRLARVVEERGITQVATYEPGGGYGHPDHIRAYQVTVRALEVVEQRGKVARPRLLSAIVNPDLVRAARSVLGAVSERGGVHGMEQGGAIPDPSAPLPALARHTPERVYALDIRNYATQIIDAMEQHATQIQWATLQEPVKALEGSYVIGSYALSNNIIAPLLSHEYYAELGLLND